MRKRSTLPIDPRPDAGQTMDATLVLRQFRVVFNAVRTHFQQVEKAVGIGGAQVWALHAIERQPGMRMNDLAKAMDIHQSTASNLVRQLVRRGLVRVEKSALDRRSVELQIEPAAKALLGRVPGPFQGVLPTALERLSPQTLAQLHQNLNELIGQLETNDRAAKVPLACL